MKKTGRNELCPCGSGKKFKHCHFGKEDELEKKGMAEISLETSRKITSLPEVNYACSQEILKSLDIQEITGSSIGIRLIDFAEYQALDLSGHRGLNQDERSSGGSVLVNVLKTEKSDPDNIYIAISPNIQESTIIHQFAHVLDFLGGSKLMPGLAKALSFDLEMPNEHLEHPHEFGYWLEWLQKRYDVQVDADDAIILFLYRNNMLLKHEDIASQNRFVLKTNSEHMLKFLAENAAELDSLIRELPGYIGSRSVKH